MAHEIKNIACQSFPACQSYPHFTVSLQLRIIKLSIKK